MSKTWKISEKWSAMDIPYFAKAFMKRKVLWDKSRTYSKDQKEIALDNLAKELNFKWSQRELILKCAKFRMTFEKRVRVYLQAAIDKKQPPELVLESPLVPSWVKEFDSKVHFLPQLIQAYRACGELPPEDKRQVVWSKFVDKMIECAHASGKIPTLTDVKAVVSDMCITNLEKLYLVWEHQKEISLRKCSAASERGPLPAPELYVRARDWRLGDIAILYESHTTVHMHNLANEVFLKRLVYLYQLVKELRVEESKQDSDSERNGWARIVHLYSKKYETSPSGIVLQRIWFDLKRLAQCDLHVRLMWKDYKVHPLLVDIATNYPHVLNKEVEIWSEMVSAGKVYDVTNVSHDLEEEVDACEADSDFDSDDEIPLLIEKRKKEMESAPIATTSSHTETNDANYVIINLIDDECEEQEKVITNSNANLVIENHNEKSEDSSVFTVDRNIIDDIEEDLKRIDEELTKQFSEQQNRKNKESSSQCEPVKENIAKDSTVKKNSKNKSTSNQSKRKIEHTDKKTNKSSANTNKQINKDNTISKSKPKLNEGRAEPNNSVDPISEKKSTDDIAKNSVIATAYTDQNPVDAELSRLVSIATNNGVPTISNQFITELKIDDRPIMPTDTLDVPKESDLDLLQKIDPSQAQTTIIFSDSENEDDNLADVTKQIGDYPKLNDVKDYLNSNSLEDILMKMDNFAVKQDTKINGTANSSPDCICLSDSDEDIATDNAIKNTKDNITILRTAKDTANTESISTCPTIKNETHVSNRDVLILSTKDEIKDITETSVSIRGDSNINDNNINQNNNETNRYDINKHSAAKQSEVNNHANTSKEIGMDKNETSAQEFYDIVSRKMVLESGGRCTDSLLKNILEKCDTQPLWTRKEEMKPTDICEETNNDIDPKLIMETRVYVVKLDDVRSYKKYHRADLSINTKRISRVGYTMLNHKRKSDDPPQIHTYIESEISKVMESNTPNENFLAAKRFRILTHDKSKTRHQIANGKRDESLRSKKNHLSHLTENIKKERERQKLLEFGCSSSGTKIVQRINFEIDDLDDEAPVDNTLANNKPNTPSDENNKVTEQTLIKSVQNSTIHGHQRLSSKVSDNSSIASEGNSNDSDVKSISHYNSEGSEDMDIDRLTNNELILDSKALENTRSSKDSQKEIEIKSEPYECNKSIDKVLNKNTDSNEILMETDRSLKMDTSLDAIGTPISDGNITKDDTKTQIDMAIRRIFKSIEESDERNYENVTDDTGLVVSNANSQPSIKMEEMDVDESEKFIRTTDITNSDSCNDDTKSTKITSDADNCSTDSHSIDYVDLKTSKEVKDNGEDGLLTKVHDCSSSQDDKSTDGKISEMLKLCKPVTLCLERMEVVGDSNLVRKVSLPDRTRFERRRAPTAHVAPIHVRAPPPGSGSSECNKAPSDFDTLLRELSAETASEWQRLSDSSKDEVKRIAEENLKRKRESQRRTSAMKRKANEQKSNNSLASLDLKAQTEEWQRQKTINNRYFNFNPDVDKYAGSDPEMKTDNEDTSLDRIDNAAVGHNKFDTAVESLVKELNRNKGDDVKEVPNSNEVITIDDDSTRRNLIEAKRSMVKVRVYPNAQTDVELMPLFTKIEGINPEIVPIATRVESQKKIPHLLFPSSTQQVKVVKANKKRGKTLAKQKVLMKNNNKESVNESGKESVKKLLEETFVPCIVENSPSTFENIPTSPQTCNSDDIMDDDDIKNTSLFMSDSDCDNGNEVANKILPYKSSSDINQIGKSDKLVEKNTTREKTINTDTSEDIINVSDSDGEFTQVKYLNKVSPVGAKKLKTEKSKAAAQDPPFKVVEKQISTDMKMMEISPMNSNIDSSLKYQSSSEGMSINKDDPRIKSTIGGTTLPFNTDVNDSRNECDNIKIETSDSNLDSEIEKDKNAPSSSEHTVMPLIKRVTSMKSFTNVDSDSDDELHIDETAVISDDENEGTEPTVYPQISNVTSIQDSKDNIARNEMATSNDNSSDFNFHFKFDENTETETAVYPKIENVTSIAFTDFNVNQTNEESTTDSKETESDDATENSTIKLKYLNTNTYRNNAKVANANNDSAISKVKTDSESVNPEESKENTSYPFLKLVPIQRLTGEEKRDDKNLNDDNIDAPRLRGKPVPFQCITKDVNESETDCQMPIINSVVSLSKKKKAGNEPSTSKQPPKFAIIVESDTNLGIVSIPTNVSEASPPSLSALHERELSARRAVPVAEYIKRRDCTALSLLCLDDTKPLWKVHNKYLIVTNLKLPIARPAYWATGGLQQCRKIIMDESSQGSTVVGALTVPDEIFLDNHWYRKLQSDPMIYAKILFAVPNVQTFCDMIKLNMPMHLYNISSGYISAHKISGKGPDVRVAFDVDVITLDSDDD